MDAGLSTAVGVATQDLPSGCTEGSCYPATGNLLIGRAQNLTATSTCGLQGPEQYCIVSHLQEANKCFLCDSRRPYDPNSARNSHRIENIIYLRDRNGDATWWQAANGEEKVSIRLDLEAQFHFTHLIMKFKTFRPAAMLIERSADFGQSWKPYRYFSHNCTRTFPSIPARALQSSDDIICEERYSELEPSTQGEVIYKVLDPVIDVKDPYSLQIQDLLRITNLRINFTGLHTLGDSLLDGRAEVQQKYYYSLYELVVRGSCFCYGHASECAPVDAFALSSEAGMVHGRCVCKHNTDGLNCERCRDFYNDLPWRPAETHMPHTCRECNCNGHSRQCHFDMAVYLASRNTSGGVCDNCLHNTAGRNCEMCKAFYYQHPARDIRRPDACVPCDCDPAGSLEGGACDTHTDLGVGIIAGQCRCKQNVRGIRCDSCRDGFFGLSQTDPQGCQPCRCDQQGTVSGGLLCDQVSGVCSCKRHVTGLNCDQCMPEYWGLSFQMWGCRSCDCDFGGAYSNRCMTDSGQCDCRPHLHGRQCSEVQSGYFCAPLDFYRYEAEDAIGHSPASTTLPGQPRPQAETSCMERLDNQLHITTDQQQRAALRCINHLQQAPDVTRVDREMHSGHTVSWTGSGLVRVRDGAGLVFTIDNVPFPMEYDIILRYEPESMEDWEAIVSISSVLLPSSLRCGNVLPSEQMYTVNLPHNRRYMQTSRPFCFEPKNRYTVAIRFQRRGATQRQVNAYLLSDSVVLVPRYTELPGFQGNDSTSTQRREDMRRYMCLESFLTAPTAPPALTQVCSSLTCSISAMLHDGALPCLCDPQGSLSAECARVGGQCQCKPSVVGRRCDTCAAGAFGFGPRGCIACECHAHGSLSPQCHSVSGQCSCRPGVSGRQCDACKPGHWSFPSCQPCQCNGHADHCHPQTGACQDCRDHTTGHLCDRCMNGFYGNPVLGSGDHCRPCPCPGFPGSGHSNADTCHLEPTSNQIVCHCRQGYQGPRCDRCSPGYFGEPERQGGQCHPCRCNNNIDLQDPGSCDPRTGQCLKCLYNTDGPLCGSCSLGYYGNALAQDCKRCSCVVAGTLPSRCSGGLCHCDQQTGACPCRDNVGGHSCNECAPHHWNFGRERGCEACDCHPQNSAGLRCNMFSGQCECRPGFGGRTCSECEHNYWGDPQEDCRECQCHPLGSESLQCDRATGECQCREGVAGQHCDECARSFTGSFPKCVRCHPCFDQWDDSVCQLQQDLDRAQHAVMSFQRSLTRGVTRGATHDRVRDLERRLALIPDPGREHERRHQLLSQSTDDLRAETVMIDRQAMGVTGELARTVERDGALLQSLTLVQSELQDINATLVRLQTYPLSTTFADQFGLVWEHHRESLAAEWRSRVLVWGSGSVMELSQDMREQAEDLLSDRRNGFQLSTATQRRELMQLQIKVHDLGEGVQDLSHKVCGDHGNRDRGCHDDWGHRFCGGDGCGRIVSETARAQAQVTNVTNRITTTSKELQGVAKELQDVEMMSEGVRMKITGTLQTAGEKRNFYRASNKELRDLISTIRNFLSDEGADPDSIHMVAQQVLAISLPANVSTWAHMDQEIQSRISNLTHIRSIFNNTSHHLHQAEELLNGAQDAEMRANGMMDTARHTRLALNTTLKVISSAEKALKRNRKNLSSISKATSTVKDTVLDLESREMSAMHRITSLSKETELLRNKTDQNQETAHNAQDRAHRTTQALSHLDKDLEEAQAKRAELQDSVGAQRLGDVTERAREIQQQARDLLKRAAEHMETLQELERKFRQNEKRMQEQKVELADLERTVTAVRDTIHESVVQYSHCL
ncbi:laminin subunit beta-1-like [Megalops cyprinoides]|uniref:laminin subunit beta-1-like n=1 Tax=Megalops cyprinoides TaxID=118141 RepID=UPI001863DC9D|nr:laminin subunit beta-1-like [Megalops cyprinoides]